jgi:protein TonB
MKKFLLIIPFLFVLLTLKAQTLDTVGKKIITKQTPNLKLPVFPGGSAGWVHFVEHYIRYPENAHKNKIEGQVVIQFVVETDGSLSNISIISSPTKEFSDEGLRLISLSPKWKPGSQDGALVRVLYRAPVNFTLSSPTETISHKN